MLARNLPQCTESASYNWSDSNQLSCVFLLRHSFCRAVTFHVCFEAVALRERFVAQRTLVRPLAVVCPHVNIQVRLASTRLPTNAADEGFDTRVGGDMVVQVALALEGPPTVRAAVRCFSGVDPHVNGQCSLCVKPASTLVAAVGFLISVCPHVDLQLLAGQEHLAADVAQVRSLSVHVDLLMLP